MAHKAKPRNKRLVDEVASHMQAMEGMLQNCIDRGVIDEPSAKAAIKRSRGLRRSQSRQKPKLRVAGVEWTRQEILDFQADDCVSLCEIVSRRHGVELTLKQADKLLAFADLD